MKSVNKISVRVKREHLDGTECPKQIRSSHDVERLVRALLDEEGQEVVVSIHLDAKNRVLGYSEVSRGSISSSILVPREAFRAAIVNGSAAIILAHNHPSGDPAPSKEDDALTRRMCRAGELLGINVLDHVIVGNGTASHYSYTDAGALHAEVANAA